MDEIEIKEKCKRALIKGQKEGLNVKEIHSVDIIESQDVLCRAEVKYTGKIDIIKLKHSNQGELLYSKNGISIKLEGFSGNGKLHLDIEEY